MGCSFSREKGQSFSSRPLNTDIIRQPNSTRWTSSTHTQFISQVDDKDLDAAVLFVNSALTSKRTFTLLFKQLCIDFSGIGCVRGDCFDIFSLVNYPRNICVRKTDNPHCYMYCDPPKDEVFVNLEMFPPPNSNSAVRFMMLLISLIHELAHMLTKGINTLTQNYQMLGGEPYCWTTPPRVGKFYIGFRHNDCGCGLENELLGGLLECDANCLTISTCFDKDIPYTVLANRLTKRIPQPLVEIAVAQILAWTEEQLHININKKQGVTISQKVR